MAADRVNATQTGVLAAAAMIAFAANSLLARLAFTETVIDPASFSAIRLISGALVLGILVLARCRTAILTAGSWLAALALFVYGFAFSFAYVQLPTSTGALILFGTVQVSMLVYGFSTGSRFSTIQWAGFFLACTAVILLVSPGATAPKPMGVTLMITAGAAWAMYTVLGRSGNPTLTSAGNFVRTLPICLVVSLVRFPDAEVDTQGVIYALLSGALTSGFGYAIWYQVLPHLSVMNAATVQLSVPAIAAGMGVLFLDEPVSLRLSLSAAGILMGIAVILHGQQRTARSPFR